MSAGVSVTVGAGLSQQLEGSEARQALTAFVARHQRQTLRREPGQRYCGGETRSSGASPGPAESVVGQSGFPRP